MHDTALIHARSFFELYWQPHFRDVVEFGSRDVNGVLRGCAPAGANWNGLDAEAGPGVDTLVIPGERLPLPDACADVVVTSSTLEHDPCFWETFVDLARLLRPGGLLYVNAPTNHAFHRYPVDCWRFYPDSGVALAAWARRRGVSVSLVESFVAKPRAQGWSDFVAVFHKAGGALKRSGRLADTDETQNGFDIDSGQLLRETAETFDMQGVARLNEQLRQCVHEREAMAARFNAASHELDKAYAAIEALKEESRALRERLQAPHGEKDV